jgi:hypothetical protein
MFSRRFERLIYTNHKSLVINFTKENLLLGLASKLITINKIQQQIIKPLSLLLLTLIGGSEIVGIAPTRTPSPHIGKLISKISLFTYRI